MATHFSRSRRYHRPCRRWTRRYVRNIAPCTQPLSEPRVPGIFSACEMLEQLAHDRIIPKVFLTTLPYTGSHHVAVLAFVVLSATIYGTSGASLSVVSNMFTLAWLFVVMLFPLSLLLLKFNRGRLPREPQTSLGVIFGAISIGLTIIGGNIAIDPTTAG